MNPMQGVDQALEFRLPVYIVCLPLLVAGIAGVFSIVAYRTGRRKLCRTSALVALVAGLLFAPSMYSDVVRVSPTRIEQSASFPFPRSKGFSYNEVSYVHITEVMGWDDSRVVIWQVHWRNGTITDLDPGDLWEWNSDEIIRYLKARGVKFR